MTAPVRRGRRTTLVPRTPVVGASVATYVCTARPLPFGYFTLTDGVEVPGAADWTRIDSWVGARRVRKVEQGEEFTSFMEFAGGVCESLLTDEQRNAERTLPPE